jgi:hypothetical protein
MREVRLPRDNQADAADGNQRDLLLPDETEKRFGSTSYRLLDTSAE